MQEHDDEEAAQLAALAPVPDPAAVEAQAPAPIIRNWQYFLLGHTWGGRQSRDTTANANAVELQTTQPAAQAMQGITTPAMQQTTQLPAQPAALLPPRTRWQRLRGEF